MSQKCLTCSFFIIPIVSTFIKELNRIRRSIIRKTGLSTWANAWWARNSCNDPYELVLWLWGTANRYVYAYIAKTIVQTTSIRCRISLSRFFAFIYRWTGNNIIVNWRMRAHTQNIHNVNLSVFLVLLLALLQFARCQEAFGAKMFQLKISCCLIDAKFIFHTCHCKSNSSGTLLMNIHYVCVIQYDLWRSFTQITDNDTRVSHVFILCSSNN